MRNTGKTKRNNEKRSLIRLQNLLPPDFILRRVFRKDGPPLGVEFDSPPDGAFGFCSDSPAPEERRLKRKKIQQPKSAPLKKHGIGKGLMNIYMSQFRQPKNTPGKKYGIGKGLMTAWRATNPNARSLPTSLKYFNREAGNFFCDSTLVPSKASSQQQKKSQYRRIAAKQRLLGSKLKDNKKPSTKRRKLECNRNENQEKARRAECKLSSGALTSEESDALIGLMDDEELELQELQAGPNPFTCSHLALRGRHSCSLCKDLLARFPPQSVKMKQPFSTRPWDSSPELVKKLFKVFRFLYTHAVTIDVCSFTLDEFAQAFHDKDSLLLGKIHVALLRKLLSDVEMELGSGFMPRAAKDSRFLLLLHFITQQGFDVNFWNRALNPLTWTEILRLVLVAAGFGTKQSSFQRLLSKELNCITEFGLRPGTLKGELFNILAEKGSKGLKVSDIANSVKIAELSLPNSAEELEHLISSTLSSDITLFEKISPSAYRLRVSSLSKYMGACESDAEDPGSVDDESEDSSCHSSSDESDHFEEADSEFDRRVVKHKGRRKLNKLIESTEIDESNSGEVWVLGLMEGEYSELRIEEKLNVLVALVDLTGAATSIRTESVMGATSESIVCIQHRGSGAKLKRSSGNQQMWSQPSQGHVNHLHRANDVCISSASSNATKEGESSGKTVGSHRPSSLKSKGAETMEESVPYLHPLQSIYLGSDRRYNTYWLFLGPCDKNDPGHRRVYFESSEDGHWEVIDTDQALCALLSALDKRGAREAQLVAFLEKREAALCQEMQNSVEPAGGCREPTRFSQSDMDVISGDGSSPISDIDNNMTPSENVNVSVPPSGVIVLELARNGEEKRQKWKRLQAFDSWIWRSFYSNLNAVKYSKRSYLESLARCESCHDLYWRDEKHCKTCHATFELDFDMEEKYAVHVATCRSKEDCDIIPGHKVLPSQLQSIKAALHAIEAAMPENALEGNWKKSAHNLWVKRLRRTSSLPELLQVLNDFVGAISEEWLSQCDVTLGPNTALEEILIFFPTIPQTASSVALWLVKLDTLLAPLLVESVQPKKLLQNNPQTRTARRRT